MRKLVFFNLVRKLILKSMKLGLNIIFCLIVKTIFKFLINKCHSLLIFWISIVVISYIVQPRYADFKTCESVLYYFSQLQFGADR